MFLLCDRQFIGCWLFKLSASVLFLAKKREEKALFIFSMSPRSLGFGEGFKDLFNVKPVNSSVRV